MYIIYLYLTYRLCTRVTSLLIYKLFGVYPFPNVFETLVSVLKKEILEYFKIDEIAPTTMKST